MLPIIIKPARRWKIFRIKVSLPVFVAPAGSADMDVFRRIIQIIT
jgi:hypothetical protein